MYLIWLKLLWSVAAEPCAPPSFTSLRPSFPRVLFLLIIDISPKQYSSRKETTKKWLVLRSIRVLRALFSTFLSILSFFLPCFPHVFLFPGFPMLIHFLCPFRHFFPFSVHFFHNLVYFSSTPARKTPGGVWHEREPQPLPQQQQQQQIHRGRRRHDRNDIRIARPSTFCVTRRYYNVFFYEPEKKKKKKRYAFFSDMMRHVILCFCFLFFVSCTYRGKQNNFLVTQDKKSLVGGV